MKRILKYHKNRKGITIVLVALMLVVLLMFLGMAVDIAYMYFVKNQLQAAADASALAGASKLDGTPPGEANARTSAWRFACKNTAGLSTPTLPNNVFLIANGPSDCNTPPGNLNSGNDPDGDIVTGNWDPARAADVRFLPVPGTPSLSINAVKVVARRTFDAPVANVKNGSNPVSVFVGQIFRMIGANWSQLNARASAIANIPPRASNYISLCIEACTGCIYPDGPCPLEPAREINKNACSSGTCGASAAWTSLLTQPTGPGFNLNSLICTTTPYVDVCANPIWTSNGEDTVAQRNLEANMYDPAIDAEAKICLSSSGVSGKCSEVGGSVQSWEIIVPVTSSCPPGAQGSAWDPKAVFGYAIINVVAVCEQGGGNPCGGDRPCSALRPCKAPQHACDSYANNTIVINSIRCISCDDADELPGHKPVLVK